MVHHTARSLCFLGRKRFQLSAFRRPPRRSSAGADYPGSVETPVIDPSALLLVFDLLGVFAFAISGNLLAARLNIDITGSLVLGLLAGIGGGIMRDVLLNATPVSLREPIYLLPPIIAAAAVYLVGARVDRGRPLIVLFDAAGLALFSTTGTSIALASGMNVYSSLVLGVITACGGGLLRDVVANEIPAVFSGSDLYLIPAFTGALGTALLTEAGWWNVWTGAAVVVAVFAFRMAAWYLQWHVPSPMRGWSYRGISTSVRRRSSAFRRRT